MDFFFKSTNWKHFGGFSPPDFGMMIQNPLADFLRPKKKWWNSDAFTTLLSLPMFCSILSNFFGEKNHETISFINLKKKKLPFFRFRRAHPYHTSLQNFQVWLFVLFSVGGRFQTSKLHCFWLVVQPHKPQKGEVDLPTCDSWTTMTPPGFPNIFLAGKSPKFNRRYSFKWLFFHCHVSFWGV